MPRRERRRQIIGWGINDLLARGVLIDLVPGWHGEHFPLFAFHPSREHPPAKVRAFIEFRMKIYKGCGASRDRLFASLTDSEPNRNFDRTTVAKKARKVGFIGPSKPARKEAIEC